MIEASFFTLEGMHCFIAKTFLMQKIKKFAFFMSVKEFEPNFKNNHPSKSINLQIDYSVS